MAVVNAIVVVAVAGVLVGGEGMVATLYSCRSSGGSQPLSC